MLIWHGSCHLSLLWQACGTDLIYRGWLWLVVGGCGWLWVVVVVIYHFTDVHRCQTSAMDFKCGCLLIVNCISLKKLHNIHYSSVVEWSDQKVACSRLPIYVVKHSTSDRKVAGSMLTSGLPTRGIPIC